MPAQGRHRTTGLYASFYWIGVTTTVACFAVAFAGNTDLIYRFEHSRFPLSWVLASVAVLSFLAAEFCHTADSRGNEAEEDGSELTPDWEAIEA